VSSLYDCAGCGDPIPYDEEGVIWCTHPLGDCTLKVHKTQECGRAALTANPEHKMMPGNKPRQNKLEKMKDDLKRAA
jgi:hypothetical protein